MSAPPEMGAVPSLENAIKYFINAYQWAEEEGIEIFYFSSFDETWKVDAEGDVGAYWGTLGQGRKPANMSEQGNQRNRQWQRQASFEHGNAICYSGYRARPESRSIVSTRPTRNQGRPADTREKLEVPEALRLQPARVERCCGVIRNEGLDFKVMLGVDMAAEMSNPHCPWGADFSDETLARNRQQ